MDKCKKKRIAVVGSGAGGCGAIYALQHTNHEVHVFEASPVFGGHSASKRFAKDGLEAQVDVAFVGFNSITYPNFCAAIKDLGIEVNHPPNTLSISKDSGGFEWATSNIFAQPQNLLLPSFWRMLFDIARFNQFSPDILRKENARQLNGDAESLMIEQLESVGEYVDRNGYSEQFLTDYLLPMSDFIWCTDADKLRSDFPISTLVRYLWNHHLLISTTNGYNWLSMRGSSTAYVDALMARMPRDRLHPGTRIKHAWNGAVGNKVILEAESGVLHEFDHVILAGHGPQCLEIIDRQATSLEREVLGAFKTTPREVFLHTDQQLMPQRKSVWSCWNYVTDRSAVGLGTANHVSLTAWCNLIMDIPARKFGHIFVSVQPFRRPRADLTLGTWSFAHPWHTREGVRSQRRLHLIQNRRGISYCGAWTAFGLHEDGFASGIQVAMEHCGGEVPFRFVDPREVARRVPRPSLKDMVVRAIISCVQAIIWLGLWLGL